MAIKMEGWKELDRALGELPKATARNVLRRVLKNAAEPIKEAMEAKAPRRTGFTAASIEISNTLNPAQRRDARRGNDKAFAEVYIGSRRGSAAVFEEFGTIHQPAHPYMRPAFEANSDQALNTISTELGTEIEKAAARLAKKAAKG